eukprot:COSAG04_NODE_1095_length_8308_cov_5.921793_8_plen_65_part_00
MASEPALAPARLMSHTARLIPCAWPYAVMSQLSCTSVDTYWNVAGTAHGPLAKSFVSQSSNSSQ